MSGERESLPRLSAGEEPLVSLEDSREEEEPVSPTTEDQEPGRDADTSEEEESPEEPHGHGSDGEDLTSKVPESPEDSPDKDRDALSTREEVTSSSDAHGAEK